MTERDEKQAIEEIAREMCHLSAECKTCQICDEKYLGDNEPCYFQCVAKEIIKHDYRKQEWISVDERLPEKNVRVLVYIKTDRSYTKIDTDRLDDRGFVRWFNDVTHWMPLPEPPKMKGGAE